MAINAAVRFQTTFVPQTGKSMHATIQSRFAPILYVVIFFAGFLTACLWFNPKDYLADLAPVVAAVCAVALVWLAWTAVSVIARKKNEWLRREKLIQQEKVHPVLHASLQSVEEQPEMLALTIRNHGKGMAKNIRLQVSSVSDKAAERAIVEAVSKLVIVGEGLDMLASGEVYGSVFGDIRELSASLPEKKFGGIMKLVMTYCNVFGETCISETSLDLSLLNAVELSEAEHKPSKLLY
ncbi:hypothetical protein NEISICOT_02190 [Neisseria sicca ATCC 29256]|jgi:putative membrane protein|uniref:Uncharacterized protein n=1 Tax=Neisseria sicca ATCC 29256 TaxID=547045 RepID=C6M6N8_NEISI|nr:hypothetical protein NEISICOT_02190 [Neisseria sicca ATCC 29256]